MPPRGRERRGDPSDERLTLRWRARRRCWVSLTTRLRTTGHPTERGSGRGSGRDGARPQLKAQDERETFDLFLFFVAQERPERVAVSALERGEHLEPQVTLFARGRLRWLLDQIRERLAQGRIFSIFRHSRLRLGVDEAQPASLRSLEEAAGERLREGEPERARSGGPRRSR